MRSAQRRILAITAAMSVVLLAAGASVLLNVHEVRAAGFGVTNCTSETGPGTIGQAISDATADAGTSETITFSCGAGAHTIPITTALSVALPGKTLTIDGGGVITLDGGSSSQLLVITNSAGTTLQNLTFAHGQASGAAPTGGALAVSGSDLTLSGDTFSDDHATGDAAHDAQGGAVYMNGGTLIVEESTFEQNVASDTASGGSAFGGALYFTGTGTATITTSGLIDNSAVGTAHAYGGALAAYGNTTLANCTFSGNAATISGGSGSSEAWGGALYGAVAALLNDTLAGDSASAPGASASGGEFYYDAVAPGPPVAILVENSILVNGAVNGATNNGATSNCGHLSLVSSFDANDDIVSDLSCHLPRGFVYGNIEEYDGGLGVLSTAGGSTPTYTLVAGSLAIDDGACSGADQRGVARPQGPYCDIGAYEFIPIASITALTATPSTQAQGLAVQLCATVTNGLNLFSADTQNSGGFTFSDGGTSLDGAVTFSKGKGCLSVATLSLGSHSITAHFSGMHGFLPSTTTAVTVFIGVEGNGGAGVGPGANPGNGPPPTGPNGTTNTGGPVAPSSTGSTPANPSSAAPTHSTVTRASSGAPLWLLIAVGMVLLSLVAMAGCILRMRKGRALA